MNGSDNIFVDTNIFIFLVNGDRKAADALADKTIHFSYITEIELLGNSKVTVSQERIITDILSYHNKHTHSAAIERMTISLRKAYKIKIPDAIIAATAIVNQLPLLTSDKALSKVPDLNCLLFEL